MKRLWLLLTLLLVLTSTVTYGSAKPVKPMEAKTIVYVNDHHFMWDKKDGVVLKVNNVDYLPLKVFSNAIQASYTYDSGLKAIRLEKNAIALEMKVDDVIVYKDSQAMTQKSSPILYNNTVYVPANYYGLLNYKVLFGDSSASNVSDKLLFENIPAFQSFVDDATTEWYYSGNALVIGEDDWINSRHAFFEFTNMRDYVQFKLNTTWTYGNNAWSAGWNDISKTMFKAYLEVASASLADSNQIYNEVDLVLRGKKKPIENKWLKAKDGTAYQFNESDGNRSVWIKTLPKFLMTSYNDEIRIYPLETYDKVTKAAEGVKASLLALDSKFYTKGGQLNKQWRLDFGYSTQAMHASIYDGYMVRSLEYLSVYSLFDEVWLQSSYSPFGPGVFTYAWDYIEAIKGIQISEVDRETLSAFLLIKLMDGDNTVYRNKWFSTEGGIDYMFYTNAKGTVLRIRKTPETK